MSPEALISVSDLTVRFGETVTLDSVNLEVRPGEIVTVIGPNGAGKTTLLRVVLGLNEPDTGQVQRRRGLRIGYMPQSIAIDDTLPLTVRRFLDLGGRVAKGRRREVLDNVGVQRLLDQPLQRISGGEMQRVLLARALLREPQLLVLDEPAQGLDVAGQADLYELIGQLRGELGCGVLMVSHDLHLVMAAADRVVCLNHHVCCTGAPHDVRENPEYLALFPETEIASLGIYTHHHDHAHAVTGEVVGAHDHADHHYGHHGGADHG
ncbi:MAG: zinc ABC transporter ATP-binding protein ZnuC [Alphaproteobacteria bacterium]|nr:zinc ABC transporter ATP-binding protein ZnuC [Alphaproteobacteria bacterium]